MEELLFAIIEFLAELLIQIIAEFFGNIIFSPLEANIDLRTAVTFLLYALFGIGAGFLSVWLFPHNFVRNPYSKFFALVVNPLICGLALVWFKRNTSANAASQRLLSNFVNGWVCVFLMALIRFAFTK